MTTRRVPLYLLPFALSTLLAAAAPLPTDGPDDLIRQANAAFARGDVEAAEKLYEAVAGRKDADMERACDWILKERRKVRQHSWLPSGQR